MTFKERVQSQYVLADDEVDVASLPSVKDAEKLRGDLAKAAQKVYDDWTLDEDGMHWEVGGGGICHLIADEMAEILHSKGIDARTVSSNHEVHVYIVAPFKEGVYEIDVPHRLYETGGGYSWKKIEGVTFEPSDVVISRIDSDPSSLDQYVEE